MLRSYLSEILCHIPDRSGLPSAVRGAGAARFGLPSAVRGMPGVGCFNHCAPSGVVKADTRIAKAMVFIPYLLRTASTVIGPECIPSTPRARIHRRIQAREPAEPED